MSTIRISTSLILLTMFMLAIGILMAFLVYKANSDLKNDAHIINASGIVRGSIQRACKLALSHDTKSLSFVIKDIDKTINMFITKEDRFKQTHKKSNFHSKVMHVKDEWKAIKNMIIKYEKSKDDDLKQKLINMSEECWSDADAAVRSAQDATESKIGGIKLFYVVLVLYAVNLLVVFWFIFFYVRNKLEYESSYDTLTGVLNRRSYDLLIKSEIEKSKRDQSNLSLIIFDLDFFKKVNDTYGHQAGDLVLKGVASLIKENIRKSDNLFRTGGEEFAIILPETQKDHAFTLAEKLRKIVEQHQFKKVGNVTMSIGISEYEPGKTVEKLDHEADTALYQAKEKGRNTTVIFS